MAMDDERNSREWRMTIKVTIPKVIFSPDRRKRVVIYALDCHTIGIASDYLRDWTNVAFHYTIIKVSEDKTSWIIEFPKKFIHFYWLAQPETKLVPSAIYGGKRILVTVTREEE